MDTSSTAAAAENQRIQPKAEVIVRSAQVDFLRLEESISETESGGAHDPIPDEPRQVQIILIGIQGSGKTTTALSLVDRISAKWLNQDNYRVSWSGYRLMQDVWKHSGPGITKPIIIDRMNLNEYQRNQVFESLQTVGRRFIVQWRLDFNVCLRRVSSRVGHKTIRRDDDHYSILTSSNRNFESVTEHELMNNDVLEMIDIVEEMSTEQVVNLILSVIGPI
jgi:predicted kinase